MRQTEFEVKQNPGALEMQPPHLVEGVRGFTDVACILEGHMVRKGVLKPVDTLHWEIIVDSSKDRYNKDRFTCTALVRWLRPLEATEEKQRNEVYWLSSGASGDNECRLPNKRYSHMRHCLEIVLDNGDVISIGDKKWDYPRHIGNIVLDCYEEMVNNMRPGIIMELKKCA